MILTDTHTHLYLDEFEDGKTEAVIRAIDAGVSRLIFPNVDLSTIPLMHQLHAEFPENTYMAMGLHPTEIGKFWQEDFAKIRHFVDNGPGQYVAIGEIGIDLYWDKSFRNEQIEAFACQVEWAVEHDLPVIIHCRDGLNEILDVLQHASKMPCGVFHSFGGDKTDVRRIRETGDFYFGINGIVTFKNSHLRDTLPYIGIERILLETDSPYLAPVPFRGKRNESAYLGHIATTVGLNLGIPVEDVAKITDENAKSLFKFA